MTTASKKKSGLSSALESTISAETKSVEDRFKKADTVFQKTDSKKEKTTVEPPVEKKQTSHVKVEKPPEPKQKTEKVIRDTFTMPPIDYKRIAEIQDEGLQAAIRVNKSEVVRAGLIVLQKLPEKKRHEILRTVEKLKPGRRSK